MGPLSKAEIEKIVTNLTSGFTYSEKVALFNKILGISPETGFPISVFRSEAPLLSILIKYLLNKGMSIKQISKILNRSVNTLYSTLGKTTKFDLDERDESVLIPYDTFSDRRYSILESLVGYLKRKQPDLSLIKVAELLHKNYDVIKTTHAKYKKKAAIASTETKKRIDESEKDIEQKSIGKTDYFYFRNGTKIGTLKNLSEWLDKATFDEFRYHVNDQKNDFADWIEYSLIKPDLAILLRSCKKKEELVFFINQEINRGGDIDSKK